MANFADIVGQEQIVEHLQNAIKLKKISHAYIIEGEKESGKEFIAQIFAKTLQCEHPREENGFIEACNECHSCVQAKGNVNPDIKTITHEKPNVISVDEIRQYIRDDVSIKPYERPYKIYIIPEGEKMNTAAQNALLKTLEEPPSYVVIIILTSNIEAFLPTILSRCVVLSMKSVVDEKIESFLMKEYHVPDYKAKISASFARGNVGKAIMLSQNEYFENMKKDSFNLLQKMPRNNLNEILEMVKNIWDVKDDEFEIAAKDRVSDFLDILLFFYRDVLVYKATESSENLIFVGEISYIRNAAESCSYEGLSKIVKEIEKARRRISVNVNTDLALEILMINIKENM